MTPDGNRTPDQSQLREVVEAVVTAAGYDLEDLTVVSAGRRRLLKVVLDSDDGVDLDEDLALAGGRVRHLLHDDVGGTGERDDLGCAHVRQARPGRGPATHPSARPSRTTVVRSLR